MGLVKTKKSGGRPPKFDEPRRVITLTLPERTLDRLASIDSDRAKAIAKTVDAATAGKSRATKGVDIVQVADKEGLIVVGPSRYLRKIHYLRLSEIAPMRYILSLPSGTSPDTFEISLLDLIESVPPEEVDELQLLTSLHDHIRHLRRSRRVSKAEILLVRLEK